MPRAAFCLVPVLLTERSKTLQLPDGLGFLKVIILMNFVKLRVFIFIYPTLGL